MSKIDLSMDALDPAKLKEIDALVESLPDPSGSLIQILHKAQSLFGYLPPELQLYVARKVGVPAARVNGVVSFYSFFIENPEGKYNIAICLGTACFVKGAAEVLEKFRTELNLPKEKSRTDDGLFSIAEVRCIGACALAPVLRIGDKIYGHVKPADVPGIIQHYRDLEEEG
ncbi:MAG: NAD(P)H-dependent oxidoreductase subunit E [Clostridiaceae bacterium]|jgi:NADH:ubiquinone oxidoreductase subunit E|nr:NAD(P)H-dependent oxidoreductase subunit E [Clostridiaceae bacterium]NLZ70286.1 NAD(P)H-dependent oxidoreductase subunit E [Clostridiaceae bacterium]